MKNLIFLLFSLFFINTLVPAQDTILVQTIGFDTMHRGGMYSFPNDPNQSFAKVLMQYTMKCWDNTTRGCREWDYSCNTFITDYSSRDSFRIQHTDYTVLGLNNDYIPYINSPTYKLIPNVDNKIDLQAAGNVKISPFGTGSISSSFDQTSENNIVNLYFMIKKEELQQAGLINNAIQGISLYVKSGNSIFKNVILSAKLVNSNAIDKNNTLNGFTTYANSSRLLSSRGENTIGFTSPLNWDGNSNILFKLSIQNINNNTLELEMDPVNIQDNITALANGDNKVMDFRKTEFITMPKNNFPAVMNEISISFWAKGDASYLPYSTCFYESLDNLGRRQVNIHLPWDNENVYWDCGNENGSYDRINTSVNKSIYAGKWTHWVFTKNANTGEMSIYADGNKLISDTGRHQKILNIESTILGMNQNFNCTYNGQVDEFTVFNSSLSFNQIMELYNHGIHKNLSTYNSILFSYGMQTDKNGLLFDQGPANKNIAFYAKGSTRDIKSDQLISDFQLYDKRPRLNLYSGAFSTHITNNISYDTIFDQGHILIHYGVENNKLVGLDTSYVWDPGFNYILDANGKVKDSTEVPLEVELVPEKLNYYGYLNSKYELLSLVTPYGNNLNLGPDGKTFTIDVTDFLPILKSDKFLSVELGGEWQEKLDIKFLFIKGKPSRDVLKIQNIWPFGRGAYASIANDDYNETRKAHLMPNASSFKIRQSITGHEQNGEFVKRSHFINLNGGQREFNFDVWKECSTVPIYPQGGTWLLDRAGWCPGDPTTLFELNLDPYVKPGTDVDIDYGVSGTLLSEANYLVSSQLVSYGAWNFKNNVAIADIIKPSSRVEFQRFNPSCSYPKVRVRNEGSDAITQLKFEYYFENGTKESYTWNGQLNTNQTADIELPVLNNAFWKPLVGTSQGRIIIEIPEVNGKADENTWDNKVSSIANVPILFNEKLQLLCSTNSRGAETHYLVKDNAGKIILDRKGLANNKIFTDDLQLAPGCYTIEMQDSNDDGLYFWFYENQGLNIGRGSFVIKKYPASGGNPITVISFNPEFGRYIYYDFIVGSLTNTSDDTKLIDFLSVYPNPSSADVKIDVKTKHPTELQIHMIDLQGKTVLSKIQSSSGSKIDEINLDVQHLNRGIYFIEIKSNENSVSRKIVLE